MHAGWELRPLRAEQCAAMAGCAFAGFAVGVLACVLVARHA